MPGPSPRRSGADRGSPMLSRLLVVATLALAAAAFAASPNAAAGAEAPAPPGGGSTAAALPPGNPVVARVNGVELHLSDVEAAPSLAAASTETGAGANLP